MLLVAPFFDWRVGFKALVENIIVVKAMHSTSCNFNLKSKQHDVTDNTIFYFRVNLNAFFNNILDFEFYGYKIL